MDTPERKMQKAKAGLLIHQPFLCFSDFVFAANRSDPESGSLIPIAKVHSPRVMLGKILFLIFSVAYFRSTGPLWRSAVKCALVGAPAKRSSSVIMYLSKWERSCPPYFLGQVIPIQPFSPNRRLKLRSNPSPSCGLNVPFSISELRNSRTSERNLLASEGREVKSKEIIPVITFIFPVPFLRSRQHWPEAIWPRCQHVFPQLNSPCGLATELITPSPKRMSKLV